MATIKHLLNWGPDTPYCHTEVSFDPAEFGSEPELREFLSTQIIDALEMKELYAKSALGIGPGGMVQEAKNLGANEIAPRPAAPQMPTPQQTQHRRGQLPRDGKWSGVAHAQCGFEFAFKPSWYNQKTGKRVGASLQCTGGCKNDRGYAYSEWVQDADLAMFEAP